MHAVVREPEDFEQAVVSDPIQDEVARSANPVLRPSRSVGVSEMKRPDANFSRNRLRIGRTRVGLEHADGG